MPPKPDKSYRTIDSGLGVPRSSLDVYQRQLIYDEAAQAAALFDPIFSDPALQQALLDDAAQAPSDGSRQPAPGHQPSPSRHPAQVQRSSQQQATTSRTMLPHTPPRTNAPTQPLSPWGRPAQDVVWTGPLFVPPALRERPGTLEEIRYQSPPPPFVIPQTATVAQPSTTVRYPRYQPSAQPVLGPSSHSGPSGASSRRDNAPPPRPSGAGYSFTRPPEIIDHDDTGGAFGSFRPLDAQPSHPPPGQTLPSSLSPLGAQSYRPPPGQTLHHNQPQFGAQSHPPPPPHPPLPPPAPISAHSSRQPSDRTLRLQGAQRSPTQSYARAVVQSPTHQAAPNTYIPPPRLQPSHTAQIRPTSSAYTPPTRPQPTQTAPTSRNAPPPPTNTNSAPSFPTRILPPTGANPPAAQSVFTSRLLDDAEVSDDEIEEFSDEETDHAPVVPRQQAENIILAQQMMLRQEQQNARDLRAQVDELKRANRRK
ncbi:hypothetical protein CALCODRAFT_486800 [Calocera cornea HHB12733]|uniref:Uncharacterized protein n=1 Tax=Calocera cornea HHB12733 TaxID=1353952 RepID=A0A165DI77_9BASI|nr:hypothetical protein CALCODRAFT_486800 [Calocera cornea HHB12733]